MTGMQQIDAASDYYVPRHAAWLVNADPAAPEASGAASETSPVEPLVTSDAEPASYQFPVMYAPPGQKARDDVPVTEPKRFWRGRKPGGAPRSISS